MISSKRAVELVRDQKPDLAETAQALLSQTRQGCWTVWNDIPEKADSVVVAFVRTSDGGVSLTGE